MKKIIRALFIILIGLIFFGVGYILGGYKLNNLFYNNFYGFNYWRGDMDYKYEKREDIDLQGVKNVYLNISIANVHIRTVDDDIASYTIQKIDPKYFHVNIKNDTIIFEDKTSKKFINNLWRANKMRTPNVYINLPKNIKLNSLEIYAGVGELKIDDFIVEKLELSTGIGETKVKNLKVNTTAKIECGIGRITFQDSDVNNLIVKSGVGEFKFKGKVSGKTIIQGGIGSTYFNIDGSRENYSYEINAGLGDVRINDRLVKNFFAGQESYHSDSHNSINIQGGIGSIQIKFKED